jgi:Arginase/agmatinase/formimionoglutamate hydrolase, arginase family
MNFDQDGVALANGNFFGLPYSTEEADLIIQPVPWDVTTSYRPGAGKAPEAVRQASLQVDLFDANIPEAWKLKVSNALSDEEIQRKNKRAREIAESVINALEAGYEAGNEGDLRKVNKASVELNSYVENRCSEWLDKGKIVGLLGGDHSVPFGYVRALAARHDSFGILHFDAHADLRKAYEGFEFSHASTFYNILERIPQVTHLVQVGQRDFCSSESDMMLKDGRITAFTDFIISSRMFQGETWDAICNEIISALPDEVYISFDIDGLSPDLCPDTGTPVPGGLSFQQADYLLLKLAYSGKRIVGFDLCEVSPSEYNEINAITGARLLYKLAVYTLFNNENK